MRRQDLASLAKCLLLLTYFLHLTCPFQLPQFSEGNSGGFLEYRITDNGTRQALGSFQVQVVFKTDKPNGVLVYGENSADDFLIITIGNGKMHVITHKPETKSVSVCDFDSKVSEWRRLRMQYERNANKVNIQFERDTGATFWPCTLEISPLWTDFWEVIYVGGVPESTKTRLTSVKSINSTQLDNFKGVIAHLWFGGIDAEVNSYDNHTLHLVNAHHQLNYSTFLVRYEGAVKEYSYDCPQLMCTGSEVCSINIDHFANATTAVVTFNCPVVPTSGKDTDCVTSEQLPTGVQAVPCENATGCFGPGFTCLCNHNHRYAHLSCDRLYGVFSLNPCFSANETCVFATQKDRKATICACVDSTNPCRQTCLRFECIANNCERTDGEKETTQTLGYGIKCGTSCEARLKTRATKWYLHDALLKSLPLFDSDKFLKSDQEFYVYPNTLHRKMRYSLSVVVQLLGNDVVLRDAVEFHMISKLQTGKCRINPAAGNNVETMFNITCEDLLDAASIDFMQLSPLGCLLKISSVKIETPGKVDLSTILLAGNWKDNYQSKVSYALFDKFGRSQNVFLETVYVKPAENNDTAKSYVETLVSGDYYSQDLSDINFLAAAVDLYRDILDETTLMKAEVRAVQDWLELDMQGPGEAKNGLSTGSWLLHVFPNMNLENIIRIGERMSKLGNTFSSPDQTTDHKAKVDYLNVITTSVPLLLNAYKNMSQSDDVSASKGNQDTLDLLNNLMSVAGDSLNPIDGSLSISSSDLSIFITKNSSGDLLGTNFSSSHGSVSLLSGRKAASDDKVVDCYIVDSAFFQNDPYWIQGNDSRDDSGSVSIRIEQCSTTGNTRQKRQVTSFMSGLAKAYVVELLGLKPKPEDKSTLINVTLNSSQPAVRHEFTLTSHGPVVIFVRPLSDPYLEIFLGFDFIPSRRNYSQSYILPNESSYEVRLSSRDLKKLVVKSITIVVGKTCKVSTAADSSCSAQLTYKYLQGIVNCVTKEVETVGRWDNTAPCQVLEERSNSVKVQPGKFGVIKAILIVPPNTFDLAQTLGDLDELKENFEVLAAVLVVIFVYLEGLFILRKADRRDHQQWRPIVLQDNSKKHRFLYEIHVHTGHIKNAGEIFKMQINIVGDQAQLGERTLVHFDGSDVNFYTESSIGFLVSAPKKLGTFKHLEIRILNSPKTSLRWFLNFIVVIDMDSLQWYPFVYRNWISWKKNNTPKPVVVPLFKANDKKILSARKNLRNLFLNTHNWVCSFYRTIQTTFTRVQRWTCCVFSMVILMLCNALWFDTIIRTNPSTSGLRTFVTSFYSATIAWLLTTMLAVLFSRTKISKEEAETHYMTFAPIPQLRTYTILPHYFVYVAHAIAVLLILGSSFVCVLFSITWGINVSRIWLFSFVVGLLLNVLILQPIQIVFWFLFVTYFRNEDTDFTMYRSTFGSKK